MKKSGGGACRISLLSATHGRILIDWPDGIPLRLMRNVATIALHHAERAQSIPHFYRRLYRRGLRGTTIVQMASEILNERNSEIVIKDLGREIGNRAIKLPEIDVVICLLDDAGTLTNCTMSKASELVSSWVRQHLPQEEYGINYKLKPEAYRKRVERLRRIGVKLASDSA
jgi:hypothetical protein